MSDVADIKMPPMHYLHILRREFGKNVVGYYRSLESHILYASVMGYKLLQ